MNEINHHIKILKENKIPKNNKGDEYRLLEYVLDSEEIMNDLFDALIDNTQFNGKLILHSDKSYFSNSIGYKIGTLLSKDCLESLIVNNKDTPFSDRISSYIGDCISNLKNLKRLEVYLDIGELSYNKILSFLLNEDSNIDCIKCLKISQDFLIQMLEYPQFIKSLNLKTLEFYYIPFTELNLLYKSDPSKEFINTDIYRKFSDFLQLLPNLTYCKVIPWFNMDLKKNKNDSVEEKLTVKNNSFFSIPTTIDELISFEDFKIFNNELSNDIDRINITFEFACKLNVDKKSLLKDTDIMFTNEHSKMCKIIEHLNLTEYNKDKNSIVSIRSYLNRTIGELLNKALYELDIQRNRFPDDEELKTAKGSIKFIAKYLIEEYNKQMIEQEKVK